MKKIATFDDWIDAFRAWQRDIGLRLPKHADYQFEAKYGDLKTDEIEYGDFRGPAQVGAGHADPLPADPRRAPEPHRLPGRHRVRLRRAAAQPARDLALRLRHRQRLPDHGRGDAPRLADVPPARHPLRRDRARSRRASSSSGAPGRTTGCSARSTSTSTTGWTSSPTPSSWTATASSSSTCSRRRASRRSRARWDRCSARRASTSAPATWASSASSRPGAFRRHSSRSTSTSGSRRPTTSSARTRRPPRSGSTSGA